MNLSATKQMAETTNRQDAMNGDQDISIFGIDESTIEQQSLRCSLQLSQSNNLRLTTAKHNISKFVFQNKQISRLSPPKNEFRQNQQHTANSGSGNQKFCSLMASPLEYKNKYPLLENKLDGKIQSADHSVILHKTKDLQEEENLIKLVSEHLIQSIQYLQKRQNHISSTYIETEEDDVPDENIAIHTIKSDIIGPNLLSQKNETTDMEKVKYFEQNFTQVWFQEYQKQMNNQQQQQQQQQQQDQNKGAFQDTSNSDSDQESSPSQSQPNIFKRGSIFDSPMLARNQGKGKQFSLEESKINSQQISNSFSDDQSSDSVEDSPRNKFKNPKYFDIDKVNQNGKQKSSVQEKKLKEDFETMKKFMHANGMLNSSDLQQEMFNSNDLQPGIRTFDKFQQPFYKNDNSQQFNRSPKKCLTASNVPLNITKTNSDIMITTTKPYSNQTNTNNNNINSSNTKQRTSDGTSSKKLNTTSGLKTLSEKKYSSCSPPFEQPNQSASTMEETQDLQLQQKILNQLEESSIIQNLSTMLQNRDNTNKKKSIISTQSHMNSGNKNGPSHGVRFDQNIEFFDSNLDLLKKHLNQSLIPQEQQNGRSKLLPEPSNCRTLASVKNNRSSTPTLQIDSFTDQRCTEIKNQNIIQEGWLLKKSTNNLLNTYQKRYFILTSEKLFYSKDMSFKKIKGCINIKYLTCFASMNKGKQNPKKLHLRILEMKKLLKLKELIPDDITRWYRNLQQVISYYSKQEKVMMMMNDQTIKNNYKRDVITESDLESIAQTGDLIMFNENERSKNGSAQNLLEMGMLINFNNNNDLRVFYLDSNNTISLNHWERFIQDKDIYNSLIFRKIEMKERNQILPFIYESVRQHLNDNYKKKLKDALSDTQSDSKQSPPIQKNCQLIASIFQKAGLIKPQKNITKFTFDSFRQKKRLKLLKNSNLSNEITVMLKRHIFFASDNSDLE